MARGISEVCGNHLAAPQPLQDLYLPMCDQPS